MRQYLGKIIKQDLVNSFGVTVLPAGTLLLEPHLALLENHGIDNIAVQLEQMEFAPGKGAKKAQSPRVKVGKAVKRAKELFLTAADTGQVPISELQQEVLPSVKDVANHPNIFELFEAVKAQGDYTYEHNIAVGVLSTMIGRWLGLDVMELSALTMAATLHDIGKVRIPEAIINKPGKLSADEFELIKKHTIFGYEILKKTEGVDYRAALVALQHHEREDGQGYPLGLGSEQIDLFSKIVAVADIFHAMSSDRPYHKALPFYEVVKQLREGYFGQLDPYIVSVFLENITTKLIGQKVILTDDRVGEVVYINPHDGTSPLIKVDEEFIDLSNSRKVQIKRIIGF